MTEIMNLFHSNNPHYQYLLSAGLRVCTALCAEP